MSGLRILIAEDSLTARKRLVEVFSRAPGCQVVGEAPDGERTVELCQRLRPDVVTLDLMLPRMDGLEVTERIMALCPTPIVIVSAAENRTEGLRTLDALAAGAVDAVEKPALHRFEEWETALVARVKVASRVRVVSRPRGRAQRQEALAPPAVPQALRGPVSPMPRTPPRLVVMGASTGGPLAVRELLRALPRDFPLPMLLVLHLDEQLGGTMAGWLDGQSSIRVRSAEDGEPLPAPGRACVRMAPPGRHLVVRGGRLRLVAGPERYSCRPSVDELFESVARELGPEAVGCLLTGMGRDGAQGLVALRRSGALTVAQDEASCTVFGMPREAIRLGGAACVLALDEIAPWLATLPPPLPPAGGIS